MMNARLSTLFFACLLFFGISPIFSAIKNKESNFIDIKATVSELKKDIEEFNIADFSYLTKDLTKQNYKTKYPFRLRNVAQILQFMSKLYRYTECYAKCQRKLMDFGSVQQIFVYDPSNQLSLSHIKNKDLFLIENPRQASAVLSLWETFDIKAFKPCLNYYEVEKFIEENQLENDSLNSDKNRWRNENLKRINQYYYSTDADLHKIGKLGLAQFYGYQSDHYFIKITNTFENLYRNITLDTGQMIPVQVLQVFNFLKKETPLFSYILYLWKICYAYQLQLVKNPALKDTGHHNLSEVYLGKNFEELNKSLFGFEKKIKSFYQNILNELSNQFRNKRKFVEYFKFTFSELQKNEKYFQSIPSEINFEAKKLIDPINLNTLKHEKSSLKSSITPPESRKKDDFIENLKFTPKQRSKRNKSKKRNNCKKKNKSAHIKPHEKTIFLSQKLNIIQEKQKQTISSISHNAEVALNSLSFDKRVLQWFNPTFRKNKSKQNKLYHSFPLELIPYIKKGKSETRKNNTTNTVDDICYHLSGDIIYPNGSSETVVFHCTENKDGIIYHIGFQKKDRNTFFAEFFQKGYWDVHFPPLKKNRSLKVGKYIPKNQGKIKEDELCVKINDDLNNVTIVLHKGGFQIN